MIAVVLDKRDMTTASYFKSLLEQAKEDKKNEKEIEKETPTPQIRSNNRIEVKISNLLPLWKKNNYIKEAQNLEEILLEWSNKELHFYINDYFGYWLSKNKKAELQRIKGLDDLDTIILAIARMKNIEEYTDNSKIIPGLATVTTFFAPQLIQYFAY
ncbi:hypothetical protein [Bacillus swezeyi]|uniref:hypothetical protein n=1 Tax=Bacillus swezeyi TaxID=1925020 RepID=UPI003F8BE2E3